MGNAETANKDTPKIIKKEKDNKIEKKSSIVEPSFFGIYNTNNNCYVNSVIQCLLNLKEFRKILLNTSGLINYSKNNMFLALLELAEILEGPKNKIPLNIEPKKLLYSVKTSNELFNNNEHHDAHEFFIWLIDYLHESYTKIINEVKSQKVKIYDKEIKEPMPIASVFMGTQVNETKCLTCENTNNRKQDFFDLPLDIDRNNISLTSCLKKYTKKEIMKHKDKFYCDYCNSHLEAERR